jgi:hypothetical protein
MSVHVLATYLLGTTIVRYLPGTDWLNFFSFLAFAYSTFNYENIFTLAPWPRSQSVISQSVNQTIRQKINYLASCVSCMYSMYVCTYQGTYKTRTTDGQSWGRKKRTTRNIHVEYSDRPINWRLTTSGCFFYTYGARRHRGWVCQLQRNLFCMGIRENSTVRLGASTIMWVDLPTSIDWLAANAEVYTPTHHSFSSYSTESKQATEYGRLLALHRNLW